MGTVFALAPIAGLSAAPARVHHRARGDACAGSLAEFAVPRPACDRLLTREHGCTSLSRLCNLPAASYALDADAVTLPRPLSELYVTINKPTAKAPSSTSRK